MKRLLVILGGLVGLFLTAVFALAVLLFAFDANDNKDWIARKFQEETGRELRLGGNIEVTFYPWLGVAADDVAIGNPGGFSAEPLLAARHMAFRIKLLPLLRSRYEIDTVKLDGLRVNLEVAGNGRNNWTLAGSNTGAEASETSAGRSGSSTSLLNNLIIGGVAITDTQLVYDDQFAGTHYTINDLDMQIGELVFGDPLDLRLSFDASSRTPELAARSVLEGTVLYDTAKGRYDVAPLALRSTLRGPGVPSGSTELTLDASVAMNVADDTLTLNDLVLSVLGTRITANVEAADLQGGKPGISATLQAEGDDLAVLFRMLQQDALAARINSLDKRFSVVGNLEADLRRGTLQVPTLQARLLNASIDGALTATGIDGERPAISGNLDAAGPDLPTLIEVAGMFLGGRDSALSQAGRDLARVPDKAFRVATRFDADFGRAVVDVPELNMALFGATITGKVNASNINDTDALRAEGNLDARGPDLPLLMQVAGQVLGGREAPLYVYGEKLRLGVRDRAFTLETGFNADLGRGNIELPALNARLLGFNASAQLNARELQSSNGIVSGKLTVDGSNLREVLSALDQGPLGEVAQSMKLDLAVGGSSNNLRLSPLRLDLVVAGRQIANSPQTLSLNADTVINMDQYSVRSDGFQLSGLGLQLGGSVTATNLNAAPSFSGRLDVPAFNARRFLQQLNQNVPATSDPAVLQKVALASSFGGTGSSFNLNDLTLQLDDSTITGSLAVSDLATLATQFRLNVDAIDADRYLAPATTEPRNASATAEPLPQDELRSLQVQGSLNVGELVINRLRMRDIALDVNANGGELALAPFRARLYDGTFNGDIRLDARGNVPAASLDVTLADIDLGPLLQDFLQSTYATGKGTVALQLAGSGADTAAIKRNLDGSGSINLQDGVLQGVDVAAVLSSIETMIRSRRAGQLPQGGSTAFDQSSATLAVRRGLVSTNDLSVKAPGWQLTGSGTLADLDRDSIDFNMLVSVDPSTVTSQDTQYNLGGYTLPIACTGALSSPRCLPDARQILAAAVGSAVQQRLGEFLQDRLGGGTQQAPAGEEGTQQLQEEPPATNQSTPDPAQELLNRALDRLRRN